MEPWVSYLVLALAGTVAGVLNVVAGGGSFLTLPILIFLGLPPGIANGTNRVGILAQNVGAVWSFDRHGVLDRRAVLWAAGPALVGAVLGAGVALVLGDEALQRVLATLMVVVTLWTLWPRRAPDGEADSSTSDADRRPAGAELRRHVWLAAGFFAVGLYGGFIQAGVGFLALAVTSAAGLDLVRGNAVKVLTILCFTPVALAIFAVAGKVHWPYGLALAVGTLVGGQIGVRLSLTRGQRWLRRVVTATVIVFAVRLWF